MNFTKELMITATEIKEKKDGTPYYVLHILMENGQTCSLMYKGDLNDFLEIQKMSVHSIDFEVIINKYGTRLDVLKVA